MLAQTSTAVRTDCDHFETGQGHLMPSRSIQRVLSPFTEKRASTSDSPEKLRDLVISSGRSDEDRRAANALSLQSLRAPLADYQLLLTMAAGRAASIWN
jgi:hypothetical protein